MNDYKSEDLSLYEEIIGDRVGPFGPKRIRYSDSIGNPLDYEDKELLEKLEGELTPFQDLLKKFIKSYDYHLDTKFYDSKNPEELEFISFKTFIRELLEHNTGLKNYYVNSTGNMSISNFIRYPPLITDGWRWFLEYESQEREGFYDVILKFLYNGYFNEFHYMQRRYELLIEDMDVYTILDNCANSIDSVSYMLDKYIKPRLEGKSYEYPLFYSYLNKMFHECDKNRLTFDYYMSIKNTKGMNIEFKVLPYRINNGTLINYSYPTVIEPNESVCVIPSIVFAQLLTTNDRYIVEQSIDIMKYQYNSSVVTHLNKIHFRFNYYLVNILSYLCKGSHIDMELFQEYSGHFLNMSVSGKKFVREMLESKNRNDLLELLPPQEDDDNDDDDDDE